MGNQEATILSKCSKTGEIVEYPSGGRSGVTGKIYKNQGENKNGGGKLRPAYGFCNVVGDSEGTGGKDYRPNKGAGDERGGGENF